METPKRKVGRIFACQPCYGTPHRYAAMQFDANIISPDSPDRGKVYRAVHGTSLLANTFNEMWVSALNYQLAGTAEQREITHFAMLHDDVKPCDHWLDILMAELLKHDADVMSAVVPIKTMAGLTSTAIDLPGDRFTVERRLTMTEVHNLPETFSAADCGYPQRKLLVNSACWVCDFTKPWRLASEVDENGRTRLKVRFHIDNEVRLLQGPSGPYYQAAVASEDWNFSRDILDVDPTLKIMATRKVALEHYGTIPFCNTQAWGDDAYDPILDGRPGGTPTPIGQKEPKPAEFKHFNLERNTNGNGHAQPAAAEDAAAPDFAAAAEGF